MPAIGHFSLLAEVSTVFINYRSFYKKEEMGGTVPMIIQVVFFITFTVFRIFMFPVLTYLVFYSLNYYWQELSVMRKLAGINVGITFTLMVGLNLYWYYLILIGLKKLVFGVSKSKKTTPSEDK